MNLIECENLRMSYEGEIVLNNVSFNVKPGDFIAVVGENGSGKSTLVKGIVGLKQYDSGKISFVGLRQKDIGYLPQQTELQRDFPATVNEIVRSGCLNRTGLRPFYNKADKKRTTEALDKMKIENLRKRSYRELSGGQQQKVLLARAFAAAEKLLLLDEPVTGLDPIAAGELYELIKSLNKDSGVTIIMVSHDLGNALKFADKILHICNESYFGTTEEYIKTPFYASINCR